MIDTERRCNDERDPEHDTVPVEDASPDPARRPPPPAPDGRRAVVERRDMRPSALEPRSAGGVRITSSRGDTVRALPWSALVDLDWSSFGLVLGAGSTTGAAFESGVLLALALDRGIEAGTAHEVVGTSAGATGAALFGLGFEAADVAAVVAGSQEQLSEAAARWDVRISEDLPRLKSAGEVLRREPAVVLRGLGMMMRRQYAAGLLREIRAGTYDFRSQLAFLDEISWSSLRTSVRVCAVQQDSGARVVFDGSQSVPLADAVAASCAVPGLMAPVVAAGTVYVDGGLASPTSADLCAGGDHPPLIVVVSPMSAAQSRTVGRRISTTYASMRLPHELRAFGGGAGSGGGHGGAAQEVLTIEPVGRLSELVVDDAFDGADARTILRPRSSVPRCCADDAARTRPPDGLKGNRPIPRPLRASRRGAEKLRTARQLSDVQGEDEMSRQKAVTMSTNAEMTGRRRDDLECQGSAGRFLATLLGSAPDDLCWDSTHHLQGHAHCRGRELVVIAPRDTRHHAVVVTAEDWDAIRLATQNERGVLLQACAIESPGRLLAALAPA
jgi:NTE family protein